ncbi:MAG: GlsB/YeaQ/YmgE family stress response membrane protein [Halobacteriovoraceae bacterium]|nr:GlsB/YeaQ/YmgE family stress response membrane protein [Halobacteriovoraceae bacterium]|tara:strand:+ start:26180 stop:26443 length:264 start_codon:yes stop_codon:yes gene_type:complete
MGILWMIIIGFLAGLVARLLKPGKDDMGFIMTTLLGIAGAFIGGMLGRATGIYEATEPAGFIAAVVGAILLLFIVQMVRGRSIGHSH